MEELKPCPFLSTTTNIVEKPVYADYDAPHKFQAIQGIIARRLREHPKAICSYSGGSDSDIMLDLIERTRKVFNLPPVKYVFLNTGLEMKATKDHVKETAEKYGVEIEEVRPKIGIVQTAREYGIPFLSKITSQRLNEWQRKEIPLTIADEYAQAKDKNAALADIKARYPHSTGIISYLCCANACSTESAATSGMLRIDGYKYLLDFLKEFPPDFKISAKCCECCKKRPAHKAREGYDMEITGERYAEGGIRTNGRTGGCFKETSNGQYRLRPLYYVSDKDKAWYKDEYNIRYSDAYEVYGFKRTGCCGCPINYRAVEDLEMLRQYEPNIVRAAWNIFGASYEYRRKYNKYKAEKMAAIK